MIMDNTLVFSDGQAITADAGSTNVIDLGATGTPYGAASALVRDIGKGGCNISLYVGVVEAFNTLTSLQISLQVDDNAAFSSAKTVAQSAAIPLADLTLGAEIAFPDYVPEGTDERYMRLYYDVTGTAPTTDRKSTRLNSSHYCASRMPSSA